MNLGEISNIVSWILADRKPDLVISADEFCRLLHFVQLKLFKRKIGLPEEYRPGQPIPAQVYEISKVITDDLAPFKVIMGGDDPALVLDEDGVGSLPADFFYPSTVTYKYIKESGEVLFKEVELLSDKEWNKRIASFVKRPSRKYPIANIYGSKIRTYPTTLRYVDFVYLKTPPEPVYGTAYGKGYHVYDPNTSTELLWNEVNQVDLIGMLMNELGINISNADLVTYSDKIKATGV